MTLESGSQSLYGLSHILNTIVLASNEITQIIALPIYIYHGNTFLTRGFQDHTSCVVFGQYLYF